MQATTFILGVRDHVVEEVVEKLGFQQKSGSTRGQKFKQMALEKTLFSRELLVGPKNYLQHPYQGCSGTVAEL
jgi:hypothetical protein